MDIDDDSLAKLLQNEVKEEIFSDYSCPYRFCEFSGDGWAGVDHTRQVIGRY